jgi:hypothetical protein
MDLINPLNSEASIEEIDTRELMYEMIPKKGIGAELGVCRGTNAVQLLFRTKPSLLFLVDKWEKAEYLQKSHELSDLWYDDHYLSVADIFKEQIKEGKVVLHKQHSSSFLASLPDNSLDWVYIDSNHHYQCVSREIALSVKKVKTGGLIMGHDYATNPKGWGTSVIRAVNERIKNRDIQMEAITNEQWPSYMTRVL